MKYYSEVTNKVYDTVNELKEAEAEITNKANARKADAEKVEAARKKWVDARLEYDRALSEFCKKYGAYHKTYTSKDARDVKTEFESLKNLVSMVFTFRNGK